MTSFPAVVLLPVQRPRKSYWKVVEYAAHQHGVTEVAPELAAKVKAAIKIEAAAE